MTREIKKIELDFEKTFPYFLYHIEAGKTLSKKVIERVNFYQGTFFTLLPTDAKLERLFEFTSGIITPVPYDSKVHNIEFLQGYPDPRYIIETMDLECSNFIFSYLQENNDNCSLTENYMLEPGSPFVNINNVLAVFYDNEVSYFLNDKNSINEIFETVRKSNEVWYFLSVLSKLKTQISKNLKTENFDQICDNAKFIICAAYDGDSYIFWEKT